MVNCRRSHEMRTTDLKMGILLGSRFSAEGFPPLFLPPFFFAFFRRRKKHHLFLNPSSRRGLTQRNNSLKNRNLVGFAVFGGTRFPPLFLAPLFLYRRNVTVMIRLRSTRKSMPITGRSFKGKLWMLKKGELILNLFLREGLRPHNNSLKTAFPGGVTVFDGPRFSSSFPWAVFLCT